jgi:hypothetical protein
VLRGAASIFRWNRDKGDLHTVSIHGASPLAPAFFELGQRTMPKILVMTLKKVHEQKIYVEYRTEIYVIFSVLADGR